MCDIGGVSDWNAHAHADVVHRQQQQMSLGKESREEPSPTTKPILLLN